MSSSKRHFTVVIDSKEHGLYISSKPSSAARKAVSKLCADDKKRKVVFSVQEITQGSDKKIYGPYIGYMQKLDKPIELEGRVIKYKPVAKLDKEGSKVSGKKSKKQAAGSQHSLFSGNYIGGGQSFKQAEHPLPLFVHKIMVSIMNWATQHGVDVREEDAVAFAQEYTSNKPHKMRKFSDNDIEQARATFEAGYMPPQQAQQHRGHQYSHNPYNLFGQLREEGRRLGISEDLLNNYLNWYIEQPGISKIAENPRPEDIKLGYDRMVREISHGAFMFRAVREKGLSPITIGKSFSELMRNHPPNEFIWGFNECPPLQVVQKRMCFKKCGALENISCFIAGMVFNPDGSIGFFKQSMRKNTNDPKHQIGKPVVLWPCKVGHYVYIPVTSHEDNLARGTNSLYSKSGNYKGIHSKSSKGLNEHQNRTSANIVPKIADNIRHGEMEQILRNPDYYDACHEVMDEIGGIPILLDIRPEHQEAVEIESNVFINNNNLKNSIQKNPWGAAGE